MPPERFSRPERPGFGAKASLCFLDRLARAKKGGFRGKMSDPDRIIIVPYKLLRVWLCWQSEANPSHPSPCNFGKCRVILPNCRESADLFLQKVSASQRVGWLSP